MFLACSSPKEPGTPVVEGDVTRTFTEDAYVNIVYSTYIKLYNLQEQYLPTDDATIEEEEEPAEEDIRKEKNSLCLSPASLSS